MCACVQLQTKHAALVTRDATVAQTLAALKQQQETVARERDAVQELMRQVERERERWKREKEQELKDNEEKKKKHRRGVSSGASTDASGGGELDRLRSILSGIPSTADSLFATASLGTSRRPTQAPWPLASPAVPPSAKSGAAAAAASFLSPTSSAVPPVSPLASVLPPRVVIEQCTNADTLRAWLLNALNSDIPNLNLALKNTSGRGETDGEEKKSDVLHVSTPMSEEKIAQQRLASAQEARDAAQRKRVALRVKMSTPKLVRGILQRIKHTDRSVSIATQPLSGSPYVC
jgi:hypothetical protein